MKIIKKDGTLEDYNEQKIIDAVDKAARRDNYNFTEQDYQLICNTVLDEIDEEEFENDVEENFQYPADDHERRKDEGERGEMVCRDGQTVNHHAEIEQLDQPFAPFIDLLYPRFDLLLHAVNLHIEEERKIGGGKRQKGDIDRQKSRPDADGVNQIGYVNALGQNATDKVDFLEIVDDFSKRRARVIKHKIPLFFNARIWAIFRNRSKSRIPGVR